MDEAGRQVVAAVAASIHSVQPITVSDAGQRVAVIDALAAAAQDSGYPVWLARAAAEAAHPVPDGVRVLDPVEALAAMGDRQRRLPVGGLFIVEGAEQLPGEALSALCLHAGTTNTKLVLVSDPATDGPGREPIDGLAGLPWAQNLGPARRSVVARAAAWAATIQPPAADVAAEPGRELPDWLRHTLTDAAGHRSPVVIGPPPAPGVVAGLDPSARRAVQRIATSPTTVHTVDCDTSVDGGQGKAAVLTALTRTGGAGIQMMIIPIGPAAAEPAEQQPYRNYLHDGKSAADSLTRRTWQPPPGSRIVLDGADHLDTNTLTWWLRTAAGHDLSLVLLTDRANPGPQRHLTDTLAAAAPWAAHHLHPTTDIQQAATMVGRLAKAHTNLIQAHHDTERSFTEYLERIRDKARARDHHRSRDDGHDLSL